MKTKRRK